MPTDTTSASPASDTDLEQAEALIEAREFAAAHRLLTDRSERERGQDHGHDRTHRGDPSGRTAALLGLACFHLERYGDAAAAYREACTADPDRADWAHALRLCEANAEAEVHVVVPALHFHDRDTLLGPPEAPNLPPAPAPTKRSLAQRFRFVVGHRLGSVTGGLFTWATRTFGRRYRDEVWTNWYRKKQFLGILTLAHMREKLNRDNLMSAYPDGANVAFQPDDLSPPDGVTHHRTADGSWNNLADPKEGAAGTRFPRNVASAAITPETGERLLTPNPREISRRLLTRRGGEMCEVPFLNLLAASWIQFQNHDWISHGENSTREIIEIPLADDDPARTRFRQRNMFVARTQADPTRRSTGEPSSASYINEVTHWWDGSQIYGSDRATSDRLRSGVGGKLRVTANGTLPLDDSGVEETGFTRNWWVGLTMLHNLFVLEHNAICDMLAEHHPDFDDDRLFNVARLVNAAVMAKIHSIEWTPAILPNPSLHMGLNMNWYGALTFRFRAPEHRKTVATYNVANPELGGLVGNAIDKHGAAYGLTQEFVEIYRLHSLLPETLRLRKRSEDIEVEREVPFAASRQAGSAKIVDDIGMADLFHSFGTQHPGQLVLNNYPQFMQEMSIPGNPMFDLGAVDIVRARERGVPRYNEFRRQLGLNPIRTFEDLTGDTETAARIAELYDDVEDIDLLIGTLAEGTRPTGFGFGETMFQIFILNASRRLQADRFYTDMYNADVYTAEGMQWVDDATMKSVLLRHYPELEDTGLANISNAFEPWDDDEVLDAVRHPLRAFAAEPQDDPWLGDRARSGRGRSQNQQHHQPAPPQTAAQAHAPPERPPPAEERRSQPERQKQNQARGANAGGMLERLAKRGLVRFWQWRDPVPTLDDLKYAQYTTSMNPSDNVQQSMNLVIPLKDPTPVGRAQLVHMLASKADEVIAGLHNTGIVHFARFTIVGDNLVMFSIFDGDFANYIRDFVYNIGSFFDQLMAFTTDPAPTPVEHHPEAFVEWVKRVDAWKLGEDITALSEDLENLGRRLTLHMDRAENLQMFLYRGYPGSSVAEVRDGLKVGW